MPLTFIDIERQKNWRIWLFFLVLLFLYFIVTVFFAAAFLPFAVHNGPRFFVFVGALAVVVAGVHFWFSAYDAVADVTKKLGAQPPDPQDDIHKMFLNIMEEMHVVTGNKRRIGSVVIPSLSLNALAVADLQGNAVIGITEGLLSRLTRPQLETVIAHEAHHVLSGDCLETSVAASLFGFYASIMELKLSYLLDMFISREREYRADAAAVRMTRNPISLAETLHLLSRSWRGAGFIGSGFEMICIVNPEATALDESEGFWADLFSTHPPIKKRIDILLKMAHASIAELDAKADSREKAKADADARESTGPRYYAMNPQQQWQGPFTIGELGALSWLSPLTWVAAGEQQPVERAWKQPLINALFAARLKDQTQKLSDFTCPSCGQALVAEAYEATQVHQCRFCGGTLVESSRIARIIARTGQERPCSARITAFARATATENQVRHTKRMLSGKARQIAFLSCPKCKNPMSRGFYSLAHLIEVDRCSYCGLTWFDQDELAMLQCLIVNKIVPDVNAERV